MSVWISCWLMHCFWSEWKQGMCILCKECESQEGRLKLSVGLSVIFYSPHTQYTIFWGHMNGFLHRLIFFCVKPLNIPQNILHILFGSYESPNPTADFTVLLFKDEILIQKHFNSHWCLWFDYSQLMKQIPLHLAAQSISYVMHINIILASSLRSVSLQAPDIKQAPRSPSENAAGSEKCANRMQSINTLNLLSHPFRLLI